MITIRGRLLATAAVVVIGGATLAACGGDDQPKSGSSSSASASPSAVPSDGFTPLPTATAPGDLKETTKTTTLPVPDDGPRRIRNFPVPKGVEVKGPGPTDQTWQFDIFTKDPESVLAFYREALPADGYQIKNDVSYQAGLETIRADIEFTGPAQGYLVTDKANGTVFVNVESLPAG